jgi:hypothetical protein
VNIENCLVSAAELHRAEKLGPGIIGSAVNHSLMRRGARNCLRLRFVDGRELICTAEHRILAENGQFVEAGELELGQRVKFHISGTKNPVFDCKDVAAAQKVFSTAQLAGLFQGESALALASEYNRNIVQQLIQQASNQTTKVIDNRMEIPTALQQTLAQLSTSILSEHSPRIASLGYLRGLFGARAKYHPENNSVTLTNTDASQLGKIRSALAQQGIQSQIIENSLVVSSCSTLLFLQTIGFAANIEQSILAETVSTAHEISRRSAGKLSVQQALAQMDAQNITKQSLDNAAFPAFNLQLESVENAGELPVHDLFVPLTSSFLANGLVVHNCLRSLESIILRYYSTTNKAKSNPISLIRPANICNRIAHLLLLCFISCPTKVTPYVPSLVKLSRELMTYDPLFSYEDESNKDKKSSDMDQSDDFGGDDDVGL